MIQLVVYCIVVYIINENICRAVEKLFTQSRTYTVVRVISLGC